MSVRDELAGYGASTLGPVTNRVEMIRCCFRPKTEDERERCNYPLRDLRLLPRALLKLGNSAVSIPVSYRASWDDRSGANLLRERFGDEALVWRSETALRESAKYGQDDLANAVRRRSCCLGMARHRKLSGRLSQRCGARL